MKKFFKNLLEHLSSQPKIGGLQITDSALVYVRLERDKPLMFFLKVPPGVIQGGRVEEPNQFLQILNQLHEQIVPGKSSETLKLFVALPSAAVYTQTFSVPNIDLDKLTESAGLNLQMLSPIDREGAYMDWQVLDEKPEQYELLGAFVDKKIVDPLQSLLEAANFNVVAFESAGLALARIVRSVMGVATGPLLIVQVSSEGLNLFIFRNGNLYFDYFLAWQSISDGSHEITKATFGAVLIEEVRKVVNFTLSRFKENLGQALIVAPGFDEEIQNILQNQFNLRAVPLVIQAIAAAWYVALGSAMRGGLGYEDKKLISLGTESSVQVFYHERTLNFIRLWRNIVIGVVTIFLIVFGVTAVILVGYSKNLTERLELFKVKAVEEELARLKQKTQEFNHLVEAVTKARGQDLSWYQLFNQIRTLAELNRVVIDELQVSTIDSPVAMKARAPDNATVIKFKNTFAAQPGFYNVDLPLSRVASTETGAVSFIISFQIKR